MGEGGGVKLGRWWYCKYCYKNELPVADVLEDLIVCSKCGYGLARYSDIERAAIGKR